MYIAWKIIELLLDVPVMMTSEGCPNSGNQQKWIIHLVVGDVDVWSGMDVSMTLWAGAMCCLKYCVFRPWTRHKLTSPTFSSVFPLVNSQFCFGTSSSIWAMVHNLIKYQAGFANISQPEGTYCNNYY